MAMNFEGIFEIWEDCSNPWLNGPQVTPLV